MSSADQSSFTGYCNDFFDTFKEQIIIYKEPKTTVAQINVTQLFGYGDGANVTNYSYDVNSGIYYGVLRYEEPQENDLATSVGRIPADSVMLKVEADARNFIVNGGKTERIVISEQNFKVSNNGLKEDYFSKNYYTFQLELIK